MFTPVNRMDDRQADPTLHEEVGFSRAGPRLPLGMPHPGASTVPGRRSGLSEYKRKGWTAASSVCFQHR